ncbi:MAG TPA: glyoxylate/hydroxypyruvate reductase A [Burkholderiaceae bacterium]
MRIAFDARMDGAERADWWRALTDALPDDEWIDPVVDGTNSLRWREADVAVVANPLPGRLANCTQLRLIQSLWAGVDRLLADSTLPRDVPIARMVDPMMNRAMAETATWAVLSLHRRAFDYAAQQRQTQWRPLPQKRADEVAVLVLGLGQMGRTAALQLAALGYRVTGWSARAQQLDGMATSAGWAALPAALGAADIVVNLLPLTEDTRGLFDRTRLAQMRPDASLVNLARGGHVVEKDLLEALNAGRLAHAVLDVFDTEPLPATHVFWFHPRITVWPHAAAQTDLRSAAAVVAANVEAVRRGESAAHRVDRTRGY